MLKSLSLLLTLAASPALAVAPCLVGTWSADVDDLANLMALQMGGGATARGLSGDIFMTIERDGLTDTQILDVVIEVTPPGVPPVTVRMSGRNGATMETEGNRFDLQGLAYNVVATATVFGETLTVPMDNSTAPMGSAQGIFLCEGRWQMRLEENPGSPALSVPRLWFRVEGS